MKKTALVLVMLMMLALLLSAGADEEMLTCREVFAFLNEEVDEALAEEGAVKEKQKDGTVNITCAHGVMWVEEGPENIQVLRMELSAGCEDMRGLYVPEMREEDTTIGTSAWDVLAAYPSQNQELYGTFEEAVIYHAEKDGCYWWAQAERDGQRLISLTYAACEDGNLATVVYAVDETAVTGITVTFSETPAEAELEEILNAMAQLEEENAYFAWPQSEDGTSLEMMAREDLLIAGEDFLSLTRERAAALWGEPESTSQVQGTEQCAWTGLQVGFTEGHATSVLVEAEWVEGPRAIRCGDSLSSVIRRFRHGEGGYSEKGTLLYGDGEHAPYALIDFGPDAESLVYGVEAGDEDVTVYLNFENMRLVSYMLVLPE